MAKVNKLKKINMQKLENVLSVCFGSVVLLAVSYTIVQVVSGNVIG